MIRDHVWRSRTSYRPGPGGEGTRQENDPVLCGFVPNPEIDAMWDVDHCNCPPEAHEWARGWVPGAVEPTPF